MRGSTILEDARSAIVFCALYPYFSGSCDALVSRFAGLLSHRSSLPAARICRCRRLCRVAHTAPNRCRPLPPPYARTSHVYLYSAATARARRAIAADGARLAFGGFWLDRQKDRTDRQDRHKQAGGFGHCVGAWWLRVCARVRFTRIYLTRYGVTPFAPLPASRHRSARAHCRLCHLLLAFTCSTPPPPPRRGMFLPSAQTSTL